MFSTWLKSKGFIDRIGSKCNAKNSGPNLTFNQTVQSDSFCKSNQNNITEKCTYAKKIYGTVWENNGNCIIN